MEHTIAICDNDEKYALGLSSILNAQLGHIFNISAFTSLKGLNDFVSERGIYSVVISESTYDPEYMENINDKSKAVVVLKETRDFQAARCEVVDRFQSRDDLMKAIIDCIPELNDEEMMKVYENSKHWKVIGFYSPIRRCLQTQFALTMGQMLSEKGKVLYMNFENYSGFSGIMKCEFESDILDLLYYFDCNPEKLPRRIPLTVHNLNGVDVLPPAKSYLDTYDRGGERWIEFFNAIEKETDYEYLILDLTDSMNGLLEVMSSCDRIYTMVKNDDISRAKLLQYEEWMTSHSHAEIMSRTMKFNLPKISDLPPEFEMLTKSELARYVEAIVRDDSLDELEEL